MHTSEMMTDSMTPRPEEEAPLLTKITLGSRENLMVDDSLSN
jgi:hypothetical protein